MATTRCAEDFAAALRRAGVMIQLGALSAPGIVAAADAEVLGDGNASVLRHAVYVKIAAGSLPGLRSTVVLTVLEGPFAGTYEVDRILAGVEGYAQRFVAYPSPAAAVPLWVPGTILLPWARRAPGAAASAPFHVGSLGHVETLLLEVAGDIDGTDPVLTVSILAADAEAGPFVPSGLAFEPVGALGNAQAIALPGLLAGSWIVLQPEISGDDDPAYTCGAVLLDIAVPRS